MNCSYCGQPTKQYGPLDYCINCQKWFKDRKEEDGVFNYCKTKDTNPEKCNSFIQENLIMNGMRKLKEGEKPPIANTTLNTIYKADKICAACENYNFVLNE